jgi:hypothetical protein
MAESKRAKQRGMMLLDVVIGASLLAAAGLAAAQLVLDTSSLKQACAVRRLVIETISEELKRVEGSVFEDLRADHDGRGFAVQDDEPIGMRLTAPPGDADGLPGLVTVTVPDPPNTPDELLEVTVRVDWFDGTATNAVVRRLRVSRVGGYESSEADD